MVNGSLVELLNKIKVLACVVVEGRMRLRL